MKRYFKNRFGQLIELDINPYYLSGELQRVNIHLFRNGKQEFLHTLFFSNRVMLEMYQLVELGDLTTDSQLWDTLLDSPFYLFCSPSEIDDFKKSYPRVMILKEDHGTHQNEYVA